MPTVKFTSNLKRFYPDLKPVQVEADTVVGVLEEVNEKFDGIKDYVVEENGTLRKHVNIFIGNSMIKDKKSLTDKLSSDDEVYIMQALSGG